MHEIAITQDAMCRRLQYLPPWSVRWMHAFAAQATLAGALRRRAARAGYDVVPPLLTCAELMVSP